MYPSGYLMHCSFKQEKAVATTKKVCDKCSERKVTVDIALGNGGQPRRGSCENLKSQATPCVDIAPSNRRAKGATTSVKVKYCPACCREYALCPLCGQQINSEVAQQIDKVR